MRGLPEQRQKIYGIDFSGSTNAATRIWVSHARMDGNRLRIEECRRGDSLPGSGADRSACLAALRRLVEEHADAVFAFDFPFSLPAPILRAIFDGVSWEAFVRQFPAAFRSPEEFRVACLDVAAGRELRRATDRLARTPFCAYNLRMYRQTYHGIADVLSPLVLSGRAYALPMQAPEEGRAWLLEICPASTLKRIEFYLPYKGSTLAHQSARKGMLGSMQTKGPMYFADPATREAVLANTGGDALDSVIAAFAAFKNLRDPSFDVREPSPSIDYRLEGFVYT